MKRLIITVVVTTFVVMSMGSPEEKALLDHLFNEYDPMVRPVAKYADNVSVALGFSLIKIAGLDPDEGVLDVSAWMMYKWNDSNLAWNKSEFNDIALLRIPSDRVWKPDLRIYNAFDISVDEQLALVYSSGEVMYVPPMTASITCNTSARWFPFDQHRCTVIIGSWTYDAYKVDVTTNPSNDVTQDYMINSEWSVEGVEQVRIEKIYPCCPEPYPSVDTTIILRRKGCRYVMNVFLPAVGLVVLALCTTIIPPQRAEIRLLIVTLLSIASGIHLGISKFSMPQSYTLMDIALSQLQIILGALVVCNCVHLAILRNFLCGSLFSRVMSSRWQQTNEDTKSDCSDKGLLDAADDRSKCLRSVDKVTVTPLTVYLLMVTVGFLCVPLTF